MKFKRMGREGTSTKNIVINFILGNKDLIDEDLILGVIKGEDGSISLALNQIHHRSLPSRDKRKMDKDRWYQVGRGGRSQKIHHVRLQKEGQP